MTQKNFNIQTLCLIGITAALITIMAQLSVPMPLGVPMTMQSFAVTLAGILLGSRRGAAATLIYILLGSIGLPVFSNFTGGLQCLTGPTGGFLLSFPLMAFLIGLGTEYRLRCKGIFTLSLILGNSVNLLCGAAMFSLHNTLPFTASLTTCVVPFIPITIIKMLSASLLGLRIRKRLTRLL